ncbi:caspase family protein [Bradyrhizobium genosp. P]|uniref:tetratricopeptide repeat protein n=1 Tax=Bradyrhizobium genosp. P TaxID=83641 RepID=UPI003CEF6986
MQAPPGTLISFATQPRSVALDGDNGHSPYTRALAATMQHQGYGLFRTFNEVGLAVEKATHGEQLPWVAYSPIATRFYFAGKPAAAQTVQAALTPETDASPARPSDEALRRDLITDCDRLAAMPNDLGHDPSLAGVETDKIKIPEATAACNAAMQAYPDVGRFAFEAGRVASARKDYAEARRMFDKAVAAGYPLALHNIGVMYESGDGVPLSNAEAARWYKKAVALGEPIAMVDLAWLYQAGEGVAKDCAEAIRLNEAAVQAGNPDAMNNLGLLYLRGTCIRRDYAEAHRLFESCIALNNAACMNGLGVIYNEGDGAPRNTKVAREWFEKSAALGNPQAKQNLRGMRH